MCAVKRTYVWRIFNDNCLMICKVRKSIHFGWIINLGFIMIHIFSYNYLVVIHIRPVPKLTAQTHVNIYMCSYVSNCSRIVQRKGVAITLREVCNKLGEGRKHSCLYSIPFGLSIDYALTLSSHKGVQDNIFS